MTFGFGFCSVLYRVGFDPVRVLTPFIYFRVRVRFGLGINVGSGSIHSYWVSSYFPSLTFTSMEQSALRGLKWFAETATKRRGSTAA